MSDDLVRINADFREDLLHVFDAFFRQFPVVVFITGRIGMPCQQNGLVAVHGVSHQLVGNRRSLFIHDCFAKVEVYHVLLVRFGLLFSSLGRDGLGIGLGRRRGVAVHAGAFGGGKRGARGVAG